MPIYDFKCEACGHVHERMCGHRIETMRCVMCGNTAKKQLGAPAIRINGYSEANGYSVESEVSANVESID